MSFFKSLFSNSRKDIWRQVAIELDAEYVEKGIFQREQIRYNYKGFVIIISIYKRSKGRSFEWVTSVYTDLLISKEFNFRIYNQLVFSFLAKAVGVQDIIIGDDLFDDTFMIQSNDEITLKRLLSNEKLKQLCYKQKELLLFTKGINGMSFKENANDRGLLAERIEKMSNKNEILDLVELQCTILDELKTLKLIKT